MSAASGGPLDLVRHGENGWLWVGDDPDTLAALVTWLREDRDTLVAARERARPSVVDRSSDVVVDQLVGYYARVLAAREARRPVAHLEPGRRFSPGRRHAS